ncbi:hypothetical protein FOXYSP1_10572 [Fusarium oxysporum f. sp. phaseoli]
MSASRGRGGRLHQLGIASNRELPPESSGRTYSDSNAVSMF